MSSSLPVPTTNNETTTTEGLFQLIVNQNWDFVVSQAEDFPEEAKTWVILSTSTTTTAPDRQPRFHRRLPLHEAFIQEAPPRVIQCLLTTYPEAVREPDDIGRLPLHYAAYYGTAAVDCLMDLVLAFPESLEVVDSNNQCPLNLAIEGCCSSSIIRKKMVDILSKGTCYYYTCRKEHEKKLKQLLLVEEKETTAVEADYQHHQTKIEELELKITNLTKKYHDVCSDNKDQAKMIDDLLEHVTTVTNKYDELFVTHVNVQRANRETTRQVEQLLSEKRLLEAKVVVEQESAIRTVEELEEHLQSFAKKYTDPSLCSTTENVRLCDEAIIAELLKISPSIKEKYENNRGDLNKSAHRISELEQQVAMLVHNIEDFFSDAGTTKTQPYGGGDEDDADANNSNSNSFASTEEIDAETESPEKISPAEKCLVEENVVVEEEASAHSILSEGQMAARIIDKDIESMMKRRMKTPVADEVVKQIPKEGSPVKSEVHKDSTQISDLDVQKSTLISIMNNLSPKCNSEITDTCEDASTLQSKTLSTEQGLGAGECSRSAEKAKSRASYIEEQIAIFVNKCNELFQENNNFKPQGYNKATTEVERLSGEKNLFIQNLDESAQKIATLEDKISTLSKQNNDLSRDYSEKVEACREAIIQLESVVEEKRLMEDKMKEEFNIRINTLEERNETLVKKYDELEVDNQSKSQAYQEAVIEIETLSAERVALVKRFNDLEERNESLVKKYDRLVVDNQSKFQCYEESIRQIERLSAERNALVKRFSDLEERNKNLVKIYDELLVDNQSKCQCYTEATMQIERLSAERHAIVKRFNDLEERNESLVKKYEELVVHNHSKSQAYEEAILQIERLSAERNALVKKFNDLEEHNEALVKKYDDLAKENESISQGHEEAIIQIERLSAERDTLVSRFNDLEARNETLVKKYDGLVVDNHSKSRAYEEAILDIERLLAERNALTKKFNDLEERNETLVKKYDRLVKDNQSNSKCYEEAIIQIERLSAERVALVKRFNDLEESNKTLVKTHDELVVDNQSKSQCYEDAIMQIERLSAERNALVMKSNSLEEQHETLFKKHEELVVDYQTKSQGYGEAIIQIERLLAERNSLIKTLEEASRQIAALQSKVWKFLSKRCRSTSKNSCKNHEQINLFDEKLRLANDEINEEARDEKEEKQHTEGLVNQSASTTVKHCGEILLESSSKPRAYENVAVQNKIQSAEKNICINTAEKATQKINFHNDLSTKNDELGIDHNEHSAENKLKEEASAREETFEIICVKTPDMSVDHFTFPQDKMPNLTNKNGEVIFHINYNINESEIHTVKPIKALKNQIDALVKNIDALIFETRSKSEAFENAILQVNQLSAEKDLYLKSAEEVTKRFSDIEDQMSVLVQKNNELLLKYNSKVQECREALAKLELVAANKRIAEHKDREESILRISGLEGQISSLFRKVEKLLCDASAATEASKEEKKQLNGLYSELSSMEATFRDTQKKHSLEIQSLMDRISNRNIEEASRTEMEQFRIEQSHSNMMLKSVSEEKEQAEKQQAKLIGKLDSISFRMESLLEQFNACRESESLLVTDRKQLNEELRTTQELLRMSRGEAGTAINEIGQLVEKNLCLSSESQSILGELKEMLGAKVERLEVELMMAELRTTKELLERSLEAKSSPTENKREILKMINACLPFDMSSLMEQSLEAKASNASLTAEVENLQTQLKAVQTQQKIELSTIGADAIKYYEKTFEAMRELQIQLGNYPPESRIPKSFLLPSITEFLHWKSNFLVDVLEIFYFFIVDAIKWVLIFISYYWENGIYFGWFLHVLLSLLWLGKVIFTLASGVKMT
jgi:chromosome segregation ATPase